MAVIRISQLSKVIGVLIALVLVLTLAVPAIAGGSKVVTKGELRTDILVHYANPDNSGKGKGPPGGGDDGEKVLDYYELLGPKWLSLPVGYTIDTSFSPVDPLAGAAEIEASFEAWDDEVADVELFAQPVVASGVTLDFYDDENTVAWRILSGYPKAIAVTALRYYDSDEDGAMSPGDEFYAFDVVLNLMQRWAIDPDGEGPLKPDAKGKWFDVRNIATHEAGHVVGLADLYDNVYSELTMYGYASPKETKKISLEAGDIAGAQALY